MRPDAVGAISTPLLVEFLIAVAAAPDEQAAVQAAAERAGPSLEAEVAVVLTGGTVAACVGFPRGQIPSALLEQSAAGEHQTIEVPGAGMCEVLVASVDGSDSLQIMLARSGGGGFTVSEVHLARGMARALDLTIKATRRLADERAQRQRSERQTALLQELSYVQRAIARRKPLEQILEAVVSALRRLVASDVVMLHMVALETSLDARMVVSDGLSPELAGRLWSTSTGSGAVGQAIARDETIVFGSHARGPALPGELAAVGLGTAMVAPVHEHGGVVGGLTVASRDRDRDYTTADRDMLSAFADHVSLAITDARMVEEIDRAYHDPLTGLASRKLFLERLRHGLACAGRDGTGVAVLFIDLDGFKEVNDECGHAVGDQLLVEVAGRLTAHLRPRDVAARFGGDEFVVMLQDVSQPESAVVAAERLLEALCRPYESASGFVSASIGIAVAEPDGAEPKDLVRDADTAMYRAKRNGKSRWELFIPEPNEPAVQTAVGIVPL